jgi:hypothetical protein
VAERLVSVLQLGRPPEDAFVQPTLTESGSFELEQGEQVLYSGSHRMNVLENRFGTWRAATGLEKSGTAIATDARFLFCWPRWRSDKGVGSFMDRHVRASAMERDGGARLMLGGHIRHQWVKSVFCSRPAGVLSRTCNLSVQVQDGEDDYRLIASRIQPESALRAASAFAGAVARVRLRLRSDLADEHRAALEAIANGGLPQTLDWADMFSLPGAMRFGFDFPSAPDR